MIGHRWIRGESRSHEKTVFGPLIEPANHASSAPAEDPRLERP